MIPLARDGFTEQEIKDVLHSKRGSRKIRFRYDLLDKNDKKKLELTNVLGGEVTFAAFNDIKRTAKFNIKENGSIDWLSDRIQPFFELLMPGGKWISFPLGIFLLSSPTKKDDIGGIYRDVEAYDGLAVLIDDKLDNLYTVTAGTNYKTAVIDLLSSAGITKYIIEDTTKTLPIDVEFEIGQTKLSAINALLSHINFTPLRVDVNGYYVSNLYINPGLRSAEYTYKDDYLSVTVRGMEEDFDLFNVPNKWVVVRTNSEELPLKSVYVNSNEESLTSTINRGRTIVDYREIDNTADQAALDSYTERIAFEASQIYGKLKFNTALMPMHDYFDILQIEYSSLGINGKYSETEWTLPLVVGGQMNHSVRRVVTI